VSEQRLKVGSIIPISFPTVKTFEKLTALGCYESMFT